MSGRYRLRIASRTDTGKRRKVNEDAVAVSERVGVCVVCDGMGGHASGEVASRMAATSVITALERALPPVAVANDDEAALAAAEAVLREAIAAANDAVYRRGRSDPAIEPGRPMGTTLAVLVLRGRHVLLAHIGDSRIYRIRGATIAPLTEDHSVTTSELERRQGRKRKYVTRALGTRAQVRAELRREAVREGDRFVLCSDGLTDCVRAEELLRAVERSGEEQAAADTLVDLANARGGRDNISVVIASVQPLGRSARMRPVLEPPAVDGRSAPGSAPVQSAAAPPPIELPPAPQRDSAGSGLTLEDMGFDGLEIEEPPPPPLEPPPPCEDESPARRRDAFPARSG